VARNALSGEVDALLVGEAKGLATMRATADVGFFHNLLLDSAGVEKWRSLHAVTLFLEIGGACYRVDRMQNPARWPAQQGALRPDAAQRQGDGLTGAAPAHRVQRRRRACGGARGRVHRSDDDSRPVYAGSVPPAPARKAARAASARAAAAARRARRRAGARRAARQPA